MFPWVPVFRDGRSCRRRERWKLAPASTSLVVVRQLALERLRPLCSGLVLGGALPFRVYVNTVFRPTELALLARSTVERYENVLKNYLLPSFGRMPLRDISRLRVQEYVASFAGSTLSFASRDKIRRVLSSVLASAVRYGLLPVNPALVCVCRARTGVVVVGST